MVNLYWPIETSYSIDDLAYIEPSSRCTTRSSAMAEGPLDVLVSLEKSLQSMILKYTQGHTCCY